MARTGSTVGGQIPRNDVVELVETSIQGTVPEIFEPSFFGLVSSLDQGEYW